MALSAELLGIKSVSKKLKQNCCDNPTNRCYGANLDSPKNKKL